MAQSLDLFIEEGTDEVYEGIRRKTNDQCSEAQAFVNELWRKAGQFLDPDFPLKLARQFHQHFWELYLATAFHDSGLRLEQQGCVEGPDILQQDSNQRTWIEAIAIEPGHGTDGLLRLLLVRRAMSPMIRLSFA
jgi:hypothetical protein